MQTWLLDNLYPTVYGQTYSKSMDHPGKAANPACGKLDKKNDTCLSAFAPESWSRETGSALPSRVSLLISKLRLNLVLTYEIPPRFRGGVHLYI